MADRTKIEWCRSEDGTPGATWNPITGCTVVSPGCTNCYAMKLAGTRMKHHPSRAGLTEDSKAGPVWNGQVRFNAEWLVQPLRWKRPRTIFVCAHGDLFHESVHEDWIDQVFAIMAAAPQHRFQVLTKRPLRMMGYNDYPYARQSVVAEWAGKLCEDGDRVHGTVLTGPWPLPNVWLGVSAEDQKRAEERIPILLQTPAAIRFLSAEPLLGPIDLRRLQIGKDLYLDALSGCHEGLATNGPLPPIKAALDWVICGGESGPNARPMHIDWARSLRDQCSILGAFHFKQFGEWTPRPLDHIPVPSDRLRWMLPDGTVKRVQDIKGKENDLEWKQIARVGKKAAGRELDGRTWDEYPA